MRKLELAALCAVGVMAAGGQAAATVVEVDQTFDLSHAWLFDQSLTFYPQDFAPFSAQLADGDTLALRVDFLPGQTLAVSGLESVWSSAFQADNSADVFTQPSVLQFFTAGGTVALLPAGVLTHGFPASSFISGADLAGAPSTFTGFEALMPINLVGAQTTTFNAELFYLHGSAFSGATFERGAPSVPEPATWALMLAGFGLAGAGLRRQRSSIAAA